MSCLVFVAVVPNWIRHTWYMSMSGTQRSEPSTGNPETPKPNEDDKILLSSFTQLLNAPHRGLKFETNLHNLPEEEAPKRSKLSSRGQIQEHKCRTLHREWICVFKKQIYFEIATDATQIIYIYDFSCGCFFF